MLSNDKWFYFTGGRAAKDVHELKDALHSISDQEFVFHVNYAKNDFANWVEGVFGYKDLADEMRTVFERKDTLAVLHKWLKRIESRREFSEKEVFLAEESLSSNSEMNGEKKEVIGLHSHNKAFMQQKELPSFEEDSESQIPVPPRQNGEKENHQKNNELKTELKNESKNELKNESSDDYKTASGETVLEPESGKVLSQDDLKELVEEAKEELEIEGRQLELEAKSKRTKAALAKISSQLPVGQGTRHLVIKEFVYGFLIGLIFGLIMLGALMNVNICY